MRVEPDHFARALLESAPDAIIVFDADGRIALVNAQTERLFGFDRSQLVGHDVDELVPDDERAPRHGLAPAQSLRRNGQRSVELGARRRDGTRMPVEVSLSPIELAGERFTIAVVRDMTERRRLEDHLLYLSTHDALTGLANRGAFDEVLLRVEERGPWPVGIIMVDLDGLKWVNDHQGHAAGDELLRRTAKVLKATFRTGDCVARIGGDEFAMLLSGHDVRAIDRLAARLVDAVALHNATSGGTPLRLSLGTAVAQQGERLHVALGEADRRMYSMKRQHHDDAGLP
ncbi:MAG: diguanylate cyclase [Myxococcota bacterium]|jgi:diguanylate cyclase (GGDEF)-like protein/PAS domain S-box-containing protein